MTNANPPLGPTRPIDEIVRLGKEMYERDILPQIEADHDGEFVAIDVDSGCWAVAGGMNQGAALDRLHAMQPDAINILCERVGYRGLYSFGGTKWRIK